MKRHACLILLLATYVCSFAQQTQDITRFEDDASGKALIYRSKLATRFNQHFEGTYYWDTEDFKTGDIIISGKVYKNLLINIDACNHKVNVMLPDLPVKVEIPSDQVDLVSYEGRKFACLKNGLVPKAPDGFYEIIGPDVFKRVDKTLV